jgi:short-subunit dehydrogenase
MPSSRFRHIVITGASSGIGAALAEACATPDVTLGLTGRNEARLVQVAARCRARGAKTVPGIVDVTDEAAARAWLEEFDAAHPVDLLIANAGISGGTAEGMESPAQMKEIFSVNVAGAWHSVAPVAERMKKRGAGQIGVVASLAGYRGFPGAPAYCASKAAVLCWGEALRGLLAEHGVGVSVICPGFVATPMTSANPYPMPFLISAERAARFILPGLERNRARISFPFKAAALMWLMRALPPGLTDALFSRLPAKPGRSS